jgi:hypothetical protein
MVCAYYAFRFPGWVVVEDVVVETAMVPSWLWFVVERVRASLARVFWGFCGFSSWGRVLRESGVLCSRGCVRADVFRLMVSVLAGWVIGGLSEIALRSLSRVANGSTKKSLIALIGDGSSIPFD